MVSQNSVHGSPKLPLYAVYGTYASRPHLFEEPVARALREGDVTEIEGRFVFLAGGAFQDCHEEVVATVTAPTIEINEGHLSPHASPSQGRQLTHALRRRGWPAVYVPAGTTPTWHFPTLALYRAFERDFDEAREELGAWGFTWATTWDCDCDERQEEACTCGGM